MSADPAMPTGPAMPGGPAMAGDPALPTTTPGEMAPTTGGGLADVFDDAGGTTPTDWATTTAADLGATPTMADDHGTWSAGQPADGTDVMGAPTGGTDDVLGTGALDAAVSMPAEAPAPTVPAADAVPTNTGIVPPWLQTPDADAASPTNTGIVPPTIDHDDPDTDPVVMPDVDHDDGGTDMDDAMDAPMDDTMDADPLGVGA
jgi:hypothetical protein